MHSHFSIEGVNTSNFLSEGAFVRWNGVWFIFEGPFQAVRLTGAPDESEVFSMYCQDFYGSWASGLKATAVHSLKKPFWHHLILKNPSLSRNWTEPSREKYSESFRQIQAQIDVGNWSKAVPICFTRAEGVPTDQEKVQIIRKMAEAPENLIPYGFWNNQMGVMGLTPEVLFAQRGSELESMALAGTEKRTELPSSLIQDSKILKEHQFVADELHLKLKKFGEIELKGPEVLELPTLRHLLTRFHVRLKDEFSTLEALQSLHPTSALGISPFSKWQELAKLPEQSHRNFFGAPLLFNLGDLGSLAIVALRQIQWKDDLVQIGAGGGVVRESQEELEWQEILAKIDSVKKTLGMQ